jgi:hypothetical protein
MTHKNEKMATANIRINITSFFTATSTLFLVLRLAVPEVCLFVLEPDVFLDELVFLAVLDGLFDALPPDACAIVYSPK